MNGSRCLGSSVEAVPPARSFVGPEEGSGFNRHTGHPGIVRRLIAETALHRLEYLWSLDGLCRMVL